MKKVKLFNGKCYNDHSKNGNRRYSHAYIGAYTQKHAVELMQQAGHVRMTLSELNLYWSKGCWGKAMNGIEPQIGVWIQEKEFSNNPPKRLI